MTLGSYLRPIRPVTPSSSLTRLPFLPREVGLLCSSTRSSWDLWDRSGLGRSQGREPVGGTDGESRGGNHEGRTKTFKSESKHKKFHACSCRESLVLFIRLRSRVEGLDDLRLRNPVPGL